MKYRWLLFDLDNTLLDFSGSSKIAFQEMLKSYGRSPSPEYYAIYNRINNKVWKELEDGIIDQVELRRKRFQLFMDAVQIKGDPFEMNSRYLEQIVQHPVLVPYAMELLEWCADKFDLAIVTNGLKEVQRPRLEQANMIHYFKSITVSDEIGSSKPQKAFFDHVFNDINHPPKSEVLIIGDSLNSDIKGGNNYKIDTCWHNPHRKPKRSDIRCTYDIQRLEELKTILINN